jgi:NADPH:quinone reductase
MSPATQHAPHDAERANKTMHAAAIDKFKDPIRIQTLPIPQIGPVDILIRVESAGVGVWDPFEQAGGFAEMMGTKPTFPYVLGSEGAGKVEAVGDKVKKFKIGDLVYAVALANPKGGFYAEYVAVAEEQASLIPGKLRIDQASAFPIDAITALAGLEKMRLKKGESILIFGASGGIGHLAVQFAKRLGARVLAVASGKDGVALVEKLGADVVIDGHKDDILGTARSFSPAGLDCILLTAGGKKAEQALEALAKHGRVAHPNGVESVPKSKVGIKIENYDGEPNPKMIAKVNQLIEQGSFDVHIAHAFALNKVNEAHEAMGKHFLGKIVLKL